MSASITECVCNLLGTNQTIGACDHETGQCPCLPNVLGLECDRCAASHWKIASGSGCEACACDLIGSYSDQCNEVFVNPSVLCLILLSCIQQTQVELLMSFHIVQNYPFIIQYWKMLCECWVKWRSVWCVLLVVYFVFWKVVQWGNRRIGREKFYLNAEWKESVCDM